MLSTDSGVPDAHQATPPPMIPLKLALPMIGITAPTFYRWLRSGRIDDCRVRGEKGETLLTAAAIQDLRRAATRVDLTG